MIQIVLPPILRNSARLYWKIHILDINNLSLRWADFQLIDA
jgi:hypothetical protein